MVTSLGRSVHKIQIDPAFGPDITRYIDMTFAFKGTRTRILQRGDIRVLLLDLLRAKPLHGYELAKKISDLSRGFYEPSPGVVYPTLQWLEDEGYVGITVKKGKKVYNISRKGASLLKEEREGLERMKYLMRRLAEGEQAALVASGRRLAQTVMLLFSDVSDEKARRAKLILDEAREKIADLMSQ